MRYRISIGATLLAVIIAAMFAPASQLSQSQVHRSGALRVAVEDGSEMTVYEESHALVIGASAYDKDKGWSQLPGVAKDVTEVSSALEEQGFVVERLLNPTLVSFDQAMRKFIGEYGQSLNSRLVVYFAGHGATIKTEDGRSLGYIVPTDAPLPSGKGAFKQGAVSMELFQTYAKQIESRHALFVFDSCFSGSLFHETMRSVPNYVISRMTQPVRQFITAGTEDQEVPDQSVFREEFVRALKGEADLNGDKYVTGTELGVFMQDKVTEYSRGTQTPQWGKIIDPELNRGDFLFSMLGSGEKPPALTAVDLSTLSKTINPAELSFWARIANSTDPEDYKAFLAKYPTGTFAPVAEMRASQRGQLRSPHPAGNPPDDNLVRSIFKPIGFQPSPQQPTASDRVSNPGGESWYVILGSFGLSHQDKANAVMLKYQAMGYDARLINSNWGDFPNFARSLWVIVIGPSSQSVARGLAREIRPKVKERPYYKQAVK